jgi:hypothetical protein
MEVFGISVAVIEEVTLMAGNFANARTFLVSGNAGANPLWLFFMIERGD